MNSSEANTPAASANDVVISSGSYPLRVYYTSPAPEESVSVRPESSPAPRFKRGTATLGRTTSFARDDSHIRRVSRPRVSPSTFEFYTSFAHKRRSTLGQPEDRDDSCGPTELDVPVMIPRLDRRKSSVAAWAHSLGAGIMDTKAPWLLSPSSQFEPPAALNHLNHLASMMRDTAPPSDASTQTDALPIYYSSTQESAFHGGKPNAQAPFATPIGTSGFVSLSDQQQPARFRSKYSLGHSNPQASPNGRHLYRDHRGPPVQDDASDLQSSSSAASTASISRLPVLSKDFSRLKRPNGWGETNYKFSRKLDGLQHSLTNMQDTFGAHLHQLEQMIARSNSNLDLRFEILYNLLSQDCTTIQPCTPVQPAPAQAVKSPPVPKPVYTFEEPKSVYTFEELPFAPPMPATEDLEQLYNIEADMSTPTLDKGIKFSPNTLNSTLQESEMQQLEAEPPAFLAENEHIAESPIADLAARPVDPRVGTAVANKHSAPVAFRQSFNPVHFVTELASPAVPNVEEIELRSLVGVSNRSLGIQESSLLSVELDALNGKSCQMTDAQEPRRYAAGEELQDLITAIVRDKVAQHLKEREPNPNEPILDVIHEFADETVKANECEAAHLPTPASPNLSIQTNSMQEGERMIELTLVLGSPPPGADLFPEDSLHAIPTLSLNDETAEIGALQAPLPESPKVALDGMGEESFTNELLLMASALLLNDKEAMADSPQVTLPESLSAPAEDVVEGPFAEETRKVSELFLVDTDIMMDALQISLPESPEVSWNALSDESFTQELGYLTLEIFHFNEEMTSNALHAPLPVSPEASQKNLYMADAAQVLAEELMHHEAALDTPHVSLSESPKAVISDLSRKSFTEELLRMTTEILVSDTRAKIIALHVPLPDSSRASLDYKSTGTQEFLSVATNRLLSGTMIMSNALQVPLPESPTLSTAALSREFFVEELRVIVEPSMVDVFQISLQKSPTASPDTLFFENTRASLREVSERLFDDHDAAAEELLIPLPASPMASPSGLSHCSICTTQDAPCTKSKSSRCALSGQYAMPLDEPTSSIEAGTQFELVNLWEKMMGRTALPPSPPLTPRLLHRKESISQF